MQRLISKMLKLNNGLSMPQLGLGTWNSKPGEVKQAVIDAISTGYRHIDGAFIYRNEKEVGEGIRAKINDGSVKREELFITTKLWCNAHHPDYVLPAIKKSLENFGLDYVDMYLIHWPMGFKPGDELIPMENGKIAIDNETDLASTWKEMEKLVSLGLTKSIGISNFNHKQIEYILQNCTIPPANNQIELHPFLQQNRLVDFCKEKGIIVTAYSPFGNPGHPYAGPDHSRILEEAKLLELAKKYGKQPTHIILKWLLQRGIVAIPKSVTKSRIVDNFNIFDFSLDDEDMKVMGSLDKGAGGRINYLKDWSHSKDYFLNEEY